MSQKYRSLRALTWHSMFVVCTFSKHGAQMLVLLSVHGIHNMTQSLSLLRSTVFSRHITAVVGH